MAGQTEELANFTRLPLHLQQRCAFICSVVRCQAVPHMELCRLSVGGEPKTREQWVSGVTQEYAASQSHK